MSYELIRVEKTKNREGQEEVFVQVQYTNNLEEVIPFAKWLNSGEMETYLADEKVLAALIEKWEPGAKLQHEETKAADVASQVTVEKVIAALVEANVIAKPKQGKFSQVEMGRVKSAVPLMDKAKIFALVEAGG